MLAPSVLAISAEGVDARTAAGAGWVAPTAYDLINTVTGVRAGDSVLIHAASGGVGTPAAQFATAAGAQRIVGVVSNSDRAHYARHFGYHQLLTREEFPEALGGEPFDVIVDPAGGATRGADLAHLAPHGRLAFYRNIATFEPVAASTNDLLVNGQSVMTYNSNLLRDDLGWVAGARQGSGVAVRQVCRPGPAGSASGRATPAVISTRNVPAASVYTGAPSAVVSPVAWTVTTSAGPWVPGVPGRVTA